MTPTKSKSTFPALALISLAALCCLSACDSSPGPSDSDSGTPENASKDCDAFCNNGDALTVDDVKTVLAQGIHEAKALNVEATIAVSDRVGNILAVYRMGDAADREVVIASELDAMGQPVIDSGLEGIRLPTTNLPLNLDGQAAISKAITGAYLSSEGNAFSTRTANQIVQEHFNPGELFQVAGPLFGVQFSQLACSDFSLRYNGTGVDVGPKRAPLGLAADPGGFPLYKNGTVVGGVGVMADGVYGLDKSIIDLDNDIDEHIALAATFGYAAPVQRRADRITVEGKTLRFSDVEFTGLNATPSAATDFDALSPADGSLIAVTGYNDSVILAGTAFGSAESGIRPAQGSLAQLDAFVLVDHSNSNRFPPIDGSDGAQALVANEVEELLSEALKIANRSRAQIRQPLSTSARVTISVVDTNGEILGIVRSRDAPVFGADVSIQKARTAAFFSSANAASTLTSLPNARYIDTTGSVPAVTATASFSGYLNALRTFIGNSTALADGAFAFSDRAGGNLSRPFFPDGIQGNDHGPLSKAPGSWSPFSTGLQSDLVMNGILQHVLFSTGALPNDVAPACGGVDFDISAGTISVSDSALTNNILANGLQIFPGSVPIYRGNILVGGIGVSGDGVDQDDMIAFLGLHNAALNLGGSINTPPIDMRADQLSPRDTRLRFIQCPQSPFLDSDEQTPCEGK